ncbi:MAG: AsmA family protein [Alphaproteobacteria bacterium]|nr:AsmA family protein [Alphaproteobacteria bacterium]
MNNFLVAIAGFICTVLLAVIFAPYFIDWNSFKDEIEAAGRQITGQNVQIVGDVELRILPQPVFHTGGLVITNADDKKLLETSDFILELDFPSLLRGKVEVTSMHLNDGKIFVAKADGAQLNLFNFGGNVGQPIGLDDISIRKLLLNNMDVEFANELTNSSKTVSINQAEVTARSLIGPFRVKGTLNVDADDTVYQREFSLSVGKYAAEKPLAVKFQIKGEQKNSRLNFLGNLVGLEQQPLLTGELSFKGQKGENLVGYGQSFGSLLSDDLAIDSLVSINYSGVKLDNLKIVMGAQNGVDINESLKINGDLNYIWGRKASLDGALNIGVANFNYIKRQFLPQQELNVDRAVYQSLQKLSSMAKNWVTDHLVVLTDQDLAEAHQFNGNVGINIEQLNFLQNNVIDRVRLINSLVNIENDRFSVPQFSAHFPGNSKLSYALSKQSVGQSEDRLMTGDYNFNTLHLDKFSNWLLFKNQKINNVSDFWGLNGQLTSQGSVDILIDGVKISSPSVKTRAYIYALDYSYSDGLHDFDINLDRLSFDNDDLKAFQDYIAPYAQNGLMADKGQKLSREYHLLPVDLIEDIGDIKLNFHGNESFYGIRNLGVFDAVLIFNAEATMLERLSLIGEKIYVTATGNIPHQFQPKNIIDAEKNAAIFEFSIVDADMNVTSQLVYDQLFKDNLFLNKILPSRAALNVNGLLTTASEEGDFSLNASGKIGSSDLNIDAEFLLKNGKFTQKAIHYQMSHIDPSKLLSQFGLDDLLLDESNQIEADDDGIVRMIISQNPNDTKVQDVKFLAIAGGQAIEFTAQNVAGETLDLDGELQLNLSSFGLVANRMGLFDGNFNHMQDAVNLDAKLKIKDGKTRLSAQSIHMLNTDFNQFDLTISEPHILDFLGQTDQLNIVDLLSFVAGEGAAVGDGGFDFLNDTAQNIVESAQGIFGAEGGNIASGFDLRMIENIEFKGKILADKLQLNHNFSLENAEITLHSDLGAKEILIGYKGEFLNSKLSGEFVLKPTDNQLYMDVMLRIFALDVVPVMAQLGFDGDYIKGLLNVEVDLAGQGYSVQGLLSNLAGLIDFELKSLSSNHIDSDYFNAEINKAVDEAKIDQVFETTLVKANQDDGVLAIKIVPQKLVINVANGLASISEMLAFQKPNAKQQSSNVNIQLDLIKGSNQIIVQLPLANDDKVPKLRLAWLADGQQNSELIDFEDLKEYYKVKLLEKNVKRLEELQVEIKRKNDAEIARYQQEKFEAAVFKNEIKQRVEKAVDTRKMAEMAAQNPPVPPYMPFVFVQGTGAVQTGNIPANIDEIIVRNSLFTTDIRKLVEASLAAQLAEEEAEQKALLEAEIKLLEAEQKADAEAQKRIDEVAELELTLETGEPISDFIDNVGLDDELVVFNDELVADVVEFDTGNLTATDSDEALSASLSNNSDVVEITPIPDLQ